MKNLLNTRRLLAGLTVSCGMLLSGCESANTETETELAQQKSELTISHTNLGSALGLVASGYTCGGSSLHSSSCGGASTPEVVYGWKAPTNGRYTFSTVGSGLNTVLHVRDGNPVANLAELGCNDDDPNPPYPETSTVTLDLQANQEVALVVDGYAGGCGDFKLTINRSSVCTQPPPTLLCGSFECAGPVPAGTDFIILGKGNTALNPWTIMGDGVDLLNGSVYPARQGVNSIDLHSRERGSIAQTITTVPGYTYEVSFWVKWNTYQGPMGLVVEAAGTQQFFGLSGPANTYPWKNHKFAFTANSTSTKLSFHGAAPAFYVGANLDDITISTIACP
jgi:choice-of-anchor C domain-containing protein